MPCCVLRRLRLIQATFEKRSFVNRLGTENVSTSNERKTFRILLNSSYQGDYYMPAISCEAMYDNTISAVIAGREVKVIKAGSDTP